MTIAKALVVTVLVIAGIAGVYLLGTESDHDPGTGTVLNNLEPTADDVVPRIAGAESSLSDDADFLPDVELVRSIFNANKDKRNEAILEAETVVAANFGIGRGILRFEPVLLNPRDIIIGSLSEPGALRKTFQLTIFEGLSFTATETEFKTLDINNQAVWRGIVSSSDLSGTIEMTIHASNNGNQSLSIRVNTPPYYFILFPLDTMPDVYVAAEANVQYRRNIRTD